MMFDEMKAMCSDRVFLFFVLLILGQIAVHLWRLSWFDVTSATVSLVLLVLIRALMEQNRLLRETLQNSAEIILRINGCRKS